MKVAKQKITPQYVGNQHHQCAQITYLVNKARSANLVNSRLLAAILKRKTANIASILDDNVTKQNKDPSEGLSEDLYKIMSHAYGSLLEKPILLAIKLASSETTETTRDNEPTRLDVLHCLAIHFDDLVKLANQQGTPSPDLNEILDFGRNFENAIPLHTFILGLPEHRKEEAAEILNARIAANA